MKRSFAFLFVLMFLGVVCNGQAYRTSAGLRAGMPYGLTIRHFINKTNALEGIVAGTPGGFFGAVLIENEHHTGFYPGLNWYWGLGVHAGFLDTRRYKSLYSEEDFVGPVMGIDGIFGLEYTFDEIPLNISLDVFPSVNLAGTTGWNGMNGALSVRFIF